MKYNLKLYQRATGSGAALGNYTEIMRGWQRSTRAIGGYWSGTFTISQEDLTYREIRDFYNTNLGCRLVETTSGLTTWEGFLYDFRLVRKGREYRNTLAPLWWHNKVMVQYTYPNAEDTQQGSLAYDPVADSFQDDGQDFSEWETAAGDSAYLISVINSDGSTCWGFLGAAFTTTNTDDSIYVYQEVDRTTAGWCGDTSGKTPSTYEVRNVTLAGAQQSTTWSENIDSSDIYGESDYIITVASAFPETADLLRDRELAEMAWPRSRKVGGGGGLSDRHTPAKLEVTVLGYWATLNQIYRTSTLVAYAKDAVTTLINASEFITVGRLEDNYLPIRVDCTIPQRMGDLIEEIIALGDFSSNIWKGGVYANREFIYEAAPTTIEYYDSDYGLLDKAHNPVSPTLMEAGFLLYDENAPTGGQPPGSSSIWDDPKVAYATEVVFTAPDRLDYQLLDEEESLAGLVQRIEQGIYWQEVGIPAPPGEGIG